LEKAFFQLPNHSNTRCVLYLRAVPIQWSNMLKSKLPSFGSTCSQETGIRIVLTCMLASFGTMESACIAVPADELPSSPPRIRNGRPFTMICPVPFSILMCGNSAAGSVRMERQRPRLTYSMREALFTESPRYRLLAQVRKIVAPLKTRAPGHSTTPRQFHWRLSRYSRARRLQKRIGDRR